MNVYEYLWESFKKMEPEGMRRNEHKLDYKKFHSNIRKKNAEKVEQVVPEQLAIALGRGLDCTISRGPFPPSRVCDFVKCKS